MGHYYVAETPIGCRKEFNGVCPFHNGLEVKPGLAEVLALGENIELNSSVWDIRSNTLHKQQFRRQTFRPQCGFVFGGESQHLATSSLVRVRRKIHCSFEWLSAST